jgi:Kelch motif
MVAALAAAALTWAPLHPATLERTEVAAARIGHHAYVVGGFVAPDRTTGRGRALRPARRNRWTRLRDMPTARAALAVAVVGGRLYAAGGAAGGRALATLEVYDFATGRWARRRDMPTAREHLAAVASRGAVYVIAGRSGGANFTVVERYRPRAGRWERVASLDKARGGIAAAAPGGRIVVVGGEEPAGTIAEVEAYDAARRRWTRLPDLPTPRHGLGAVAYRGAIYVLEGGTAPGLSFSATAERLVVSAARRASISFGLPL